MTSARLNPEQSMDEGQNGKGESRYLAYLQLVEHVLERLIVLDQVVLRLCIKINLQNAPKISIAVI
jgi:hypothetical protein